MWKGERLDWERKHFQKISTEMLGMRTLSGCFLEVKMVFLNQVHCYPPKIRILLLYHEGRASLITQWLKNNNKKSACWCGRHGFNPWSRNIPLAMEQLSPCAITTEPVLSSPWAATTKGPQPRACALQQEKPPPWEACAPQPEQPCSRQLEKAHTRQCRCSMAKK